MELLEDFAQFNASLTRDAELVLAVLKINCVREHREIAGLEIDCLVLNVDYEGVIGFGYFFYFNVASADVPGVGCGIELFFYFFLEREMDDVDIGCFLCPNRVRELLIEKSKVTETVPDSG